MLTQTISCQQQEPMASMCETLQSRDCQALVKSRRPEYSDLDLEEVRQWWEGGDGGKRAPTNLVFLAPRS